MQNELIERVDALKKREVDGHVEYVGYWVTDRAFEAILVVHVSKYTVLDRSL